ncbi:CLUMA_CG005593, isoform A [Clunio marinus]|uniref:CLUMA_CG005593, isoform A n=1 Tax=Clunio marinus TaxID=568069 RepID=A0A1J1HVG1_9DIPT|nr:CLUMA_CG005593, isoform A [Clunio marinus]
MELLENVYYRESSTVNIISTSEHSKDLVESLLREISRNMSVNVVLESPSSIQRNNRRLCNIFLFQSHEEFMKIYEKLTTDSFVFQGFYAILLTNERKVEVDEIFKSFWMKQIHNVLIFYFKDFQVKVQKFQPFNEKKCNDTKAVDVDMTEIKASFSSGLRDLKKCLIKVSAPHIPPFIMTNEKNEIVGRDIDLINVIAEVLNFKIELQYLNYSLAFGILYNNGTATGAFKDLLESKSDLIIGDYYLTQSRLNFLDASSAYFSSEIGFVIPPPMNLKPIEKLLQPFQLNFWIPLMICFCVIFFIAFVMRFVTSRYDENVMKNISLEMNLVALIFGVSYPSESRKIYLRIFLISLVIFFLVVQAAYQGSLFKFLQTNSKHKQVQSVDDMVERDYKIYSIGTTDYVATHPKIKERFEIELKL